MKKNLYAWAYVALMCAGTIGVLSSCSEENDGPTPPGSDAETAYVIAAQDDGTSYLITAPSLDSGTATVRGTGTEVLGGTYWVFKNQNYVFALVYNKGGAGTGASYYLNAAGKPTEKSHQSVWAPVMVMVFRNARPANTDTGIWASGLLPGMARQRRCRV